MDRSLSWIATGDCQQSPLNNTFVEVEFEYSRRDPPFIRQRLDYGPVKTK